MSKRVSNKRGKSRKTTARSRVRYGWKNAYKAGGVMEGSAA